MAITKVSTGLLKDNSVTINKLHSDTVVTVSKGLHNHVNDNGIPTAGAVASYVSSQVTGANNWDLSFAWGDHSTYGYATEAYVDNSIANVINSAPAALDTLNELAAALGDDPNFATTVTNLIAGKQAAGTYNTIIGTDTDINTSGATIVDNIYVTDGVITSMGTRTLTLGDLGYTGATNANYITNNNQLTNGAGYLQSLPLNPTFSSVRTDLIKSDDNPTESFIDLDDDLWFGGATTNVLTLSSKSHMVFVNDTNSNGTTENFSFYTQGSTDATATKLFEIQQNGNIVATGTISASGYNKSNWDTSYGWGNHASAGYLTTSGKAADANLLDGLNSTQFLRSDANDTASGTITLSKNTAYPLILGVGSQSGAVGIDFSGHGTQKGYLTANHIDGQSVGANYSFHFSSTESSQNVIIDGTGNFIANGNNPVWHSGNDGSGSGLDADLLDGLQGSSYIKENEDRRYKAIRFTGEGGNSSNPVINYGIYQEGGAWSNPFPDLVIGYHTGIKIGGYKNYNGTRFYNDAPGRSGASMIFSVGDGDDSVRATSSLQAPIFYDSSNTNYFINPDGQSRLASNLSFGRPGVGQSTQGRWLSIEGNADASGEGSGRLFFTEHNSTTASMDNYGVSFGYRGGATSITTAGGNTWTGLSQIGNGQWGMWGHDNSLGGNLIMYGDRQATYVDFAGNNIKGITDIYVADQIIHTGDTNTYLQFHAADKFRVVTAGSEVTEWGSGYMKMRDNATLRLGEGSDFRMWHDGSHTIFRNYNHSNGNIYFQGEDKEGTNTALIYMITDTSRSYVRLFENGGERLRTTSGGITVYGAMTATGDVIASCASDKRLKSNIKNIENPISKVKLLNGVEFDWNDKQSTYESGMHDIGVIAQEVEAILPEIVNTRDNGYKAVKYEKIVPLLIEAIKELSKEIEILKNK